jgi:serine/threonine-protein kinase
VAGGRDPGTIDSLLARVRAALAGRYAIEREVGRGGMAVVYVALDAKHHRRVAVKVLQPQLASALGADRFLREIEIVAGLAHPHIVPLHDSGAADGLAFYVMPFIEGESLENRLIRERQLPIGEALAIVRDVADALTYAHRQGIVHRDIKPGNILLAAGHAVVADFGIARALAVATDTSVGNLRHEVGTPAYMSPEQLGCSSQGDPRSDIYSLGCVACEMLAGERPSPAKGEAALVWQALATLRPGLSPAVTRAVARALQRVPADRFASAAEFAEALDVGHATGRRRVRRRLSITLRINLVLGMTMLLVGGTSGARF